MNSARVYKRHSVVSEDACVPIPAGDLQDDGMERPAAAGDGAPASDTAPAENGAAAPEDQGRQKTEKAGGPAECGGRPEAADGADRPLDKKALSQIYQKELEALARSEAERAYFDALNEEKHRLQSCVSGVQQVLDELIRQHEAFMEQYAGELKYMAVDIAEKMLLDKISADDTVLQKLVLRSLENLQAAQWISVELSERLVGAVEGVKKELEKTELKGKTSVFAVPGREDTCRITTEEGTIVSTIGVQAENLRKAFREAEKEP